MFIIPFLCLAAVSFAVSAEKTMGGMNHTMGRLLSKLNGPCEISNLTAAIPRFTHLSCYANVPLDNAVRAKTQCLTAFQASNPTCLVNIVSSGTGSFGCDVYFVYSFASKQCRLSYQSQEKTNTGCMLYQSLGLGKAAYRKNSTLSTNNYEC